MQDTCGQYDPNNIPRSEVLHRNAEPLKIKLIKGQKESYGWEISCQGSDFADILDKIYLADNVLKNRYGKVE